MVAPVIDLADLTRIAARWALSAPARLPTPWVGATSQVYPLHDVVLKVSFDTLDAIESLKVETAVSVQMRRRGVQTPDLLAYDESLDILPVPFALFHRVPDSVTMERASSMSRLQEAWRETGRQLANVHALRDQEGFQVSLRSFRQTPDLDPRPWVDDLRASGVLDGEDAAWLRALLDDFAPMVLGSEPVALCHGDVNASNILVDEGCGAFLAIIDWGGAGWLDPVWDFAGVSLDVVPYLLAGHRAVAPLPEDGTAEARIFWVQAQTRLYHAVNAAASGTEPAPLERDIRQLRRFAANVLKVGL